MNQFQQELFHNPVCLIGLGAALAMVCVCIAHKYLRG